MIMNKFNFLQKNLPFKNQPDQLKKLAFLAGIYLAVIFLAPLVVAQNLIALGVIALAIGLVAIIIFIRYPGTGFPLTVITALIVPISVSTGTQTRINSAIMIISVILLAWIIDMIIIQREVNFLKDRTILLAFAFSLSAILSFGFGQLPWFPGRPASLFAQIGQVAIFFLSAATFIVTIHQLKDIRWLRWTVAALITLGGLYAITFLIPPLRPYINRIFQRGVVDSLFWTWLIAMSFSQALINTNLKKHLRLLSGLVALAGLINVFVIKQTWVSGWLPAGVAVIVILFLYKPRLAIIAGLLFASILVVRFQLLSNYIFVGDNEYSLNTRLEAWHILFQIIEKNPVFGLGPANYYFYTPFYRISGYSVSFNSHNNYIDLLAQTGIVGLVLFFWWMVEIGRKGLQLLNYSLNSFEQSFTLATLGGLAGALTAAFLGDWVIPFIYNVGMDGFRATVLNWIFLGGLIFLYHQKQSQQQNI